ncbi:hypothetical protein HANVADRAFT_96946 [Hanseniaspora valbyensis NRRL Y-1626]|uniref:Uncharacterized protein n=1 Tax=Hanseniaspora valbyensis NRRL Y-1626 TaxID=766949 RepID=A0A1B7THG1_9ASCO|nr:hypothetical protein HANVADRAFT_96946 [Hanseniaspora valbyensis NRRL Y-1626]
MSNNNKFKSILSKMNVDDVSNDLNEKRSYHSSKLASNAENRYRVNKYNNKKKRVIKRNTNGDKPTIINKIIGYFNTGNDKNTNTENNNDSLVDIKSRFNNFNKIETLKGKLSSTSSVKNNSILNNNNLTPKRANIFQTSNESKYRVQPIKLEDTNDNTKDDIVYKLINKQQQLQQDLDTMKSEFEDLKNELFLLKQQQNSNSFIDLSLIKEKRKMNNIQSSDPILQPEDVNSNSNIRKPTLKLMSFDKLSPIKRQDSTFRKETKNITKDNRSFDNGVNNKKGNAITSSPSKSYRNSNINKLLEDNSDEDDWRLREEDSVSIDDLEE